MGFVTKTVVRTLVRMLLEEGNDSSSTFQYKAKLKAMSEEAKLGATVVATYTTLRNWAQKRNLVCLGRVPGQCSACSVSSPWWRAVFVVVPIWNL